MLPEAAAAEGLPAPPPDAVGMRRCADAMENIRPEIKQLFADFLFLQGGIELLDKVAAIVIQR